jgi:hypothetical protein
MLGIPRDANIDIINKDNAGAIGSGVTGSTWRSI